MSVLVVDDNELNLEITIAILAENGIAAEGALSGYEAIDIISGDYNNRFSYILMDYRMPELDGGKTCLKIRQLEGKDKLVIIGLSGDDDEKTVSYLLNSGMNAVVKKPLDFSTLSKWFSQNSAENKLEKHDNCVIDESYFDSEIGIKYTGSAEKYIEFLRRFVKSADNKYETIEDALNRKDIKRFTIEVHALKSNMNSLGNIRLYELSKALEEAGDRNDIEYISKNFSAFTDLYKQSVLSLNSVNEIESDNKRPYKRTEFMDMLDALNEMLEAFDTDSADKCMESLLLTEIPETIKTDFSRLEIDIQEIDYEDAFRCISRIKELL